MADKSADRPKRNLPARPGEEGYVAPFSQPTVTIIGALGAQEQSPTPEMSEEPSPSSSNGTASHAPTHTPSSSRMTTMPTKSDVFAQIGMEDVVKTLEESIRFRTQRQAWVNTQVLPKIQEDFMQWIVGDRPSKGSTFTQNYTFPDGNLSLLFVAQEFAKDEWEVEFQKVNPDPVDKGISGNKELTIKVMIAL